MSMKKAAKKATGIAATSTGLGLAVGAARQEPTSVDKMVEKYVTDPNTGADTVKVHEWQNVPTGITDSMNHETLMQGLTVGAEIGAGAGAAYLAVKGAQKVVKNVKAKNKIKRQTDAVNDAVSHIRKYGYESYKNRNLGPQWD